MRPLTISGLMLGLAVVGWGQHGNPFPNPVRPMPAPINASPYGNILYPGGVPNNFPSALGATVRGYPPYTGVQPGRPGPGGPMGPGGGRGRTVIVPYAVPVYYGGGYGYDPYAGYGQQQAPNVTVVVPQQPAPSVIINQTFSNGELTKQTVGDLSSAEIPETGGLRVYEGPKSPSTAPQPKGGRIDEITATSVAAQQQNPRSYVRDDKPNIYLIAMKDSTVKEAIGYWVEANTTLAYVTPDAVISRVSLELVDRDASVQLNAQRKLDFELRTR